MALVKSNVFVPLGVGLQTAIDDKQLVVGSGVLELENAFGLRTGEVVKRYGTTALTDLVTTFGSIPQTAQLAAHQGALVSRSVAGAPQLYGYSPTRSLWAQVDTRLQATVSTSYKSVSANSNAAQIPDSQYAGGYQFVASEELASGVPSVVIKVIDAATSHVVSQVQHEGGTRPRVGTIAGYVVVGYVDTFTADVKCDVFATASPETYSSATLASGSANTDISFLTVAPKGATTLTFAFRDLTPKVVAVDFDPATLTTDVYDLLNSDADPIVPDLCMGWMQDPAGAGKLALIAASSSAGVVVHWDIASGIAAASYAMDPASIGPTIWNVAGMTTSNDATGEFLVAYEVYDSTDYNERIVPTRRSAGVVSQWSPILSVGLRSELFAYQGVTCALVSYESTTQPSYFVYDIINRAPLARVALWQGNGRSERQGSVSSVSSIAAGAFTTTIARRTRLESIFRDVGVDLVTFTFDPTLPPPVEAADSLVFAGGVPAAFDGVTYCELGFHVYPEPPTLAPTSGGSMTAEGTYQYLLVYRYVDKSGRVFHSATSEPATITLTGSDQRVEVTAPTLRLFGRSVGDYVIEVYRTTAGGTDFQLTATITNDPTVDSVTVTDSRSDESLALNTLAYTTGGVPDNDPTPGVAAHAVWKGSIVIVPDDNRQELWFSKPIVAKEGPGFSETYTQSVSDQHGDIIGLAVLDDRLAIFKRDAVYVIVGDPFDSAGNFSVSTPQLVEGGEGTTNPRSIVSTPVGVFYQSTSRVKVGVLDGSLQPQLTGLAVQAFGGETITAAVHVAPQSQVRLYTASGRTLVYDLVDKIWSTFTGQPTVAATSWNGVPTYATAAGNVRVEDSTGATYTEAGDPYTMLVTSPWLSFAGLGGFERFYRISGLGKTAGDHTLTATFRTDFDDDSIVASVSRAIVGPLWKWLIRYGLRCSSLKVTLSDNGAATAGPKISGITVQVGGKKGIRPLPDSARLT